MTPDEAVRWTLDTVLTHLTGRGYVRPAGQARWTDPVERTPGWVQGRLTAPLKGRGPTPGTLQATVRAPRWTAGRDAWVTLRWTWRPLGYWWTARVRVRDGQDDGRLAAALGAIEDSMDRSVVRRSLNRAWRPVPVDARKDRAFARGLRAVDHGVEP